MNGPSDRTFYILNGIVTIVAMAFLVWLIFIQEGSSETNLAVSYLPAVNAGLNGLAAVLLGLVDWELLILFIGLFVVNRAFQDTGMPATITSELAASGIDLTQPAELFVTALLLSNLLSNVPATMLLLPVATHPLAGPLLALVTTLAGNFIIVGSIANIIVVDAAARRGIRIDWRIHARAGVGVTVATLAIAAGWLYWCAQSV